MLIAQPSLFTTREIGFWCIVHYTILYIYIYIYILKKIIISNNIYILVGLQKNI